jgi:hypothetical protein
VLSDRAINFGVLLQSEDAKGWCDIAQSQVELAPERAETQSKETHVEQSDRGDAVQPLVTPSRGENLKISCCFFSNL